MRNENTKYDAYTTEETGVYKDSPYNSTPFTKCCDVAVVSKERCPICGKIVFPYSPHRR